MIKINLAVAFVLLSISTAKPMYQPILEQTCNFLAEVAPEIAVVGGTLLVAYDESRTGQPMPQPFVEETRNDSNHLPGEPGVVLLRNMIYETQDEIVRNQRSGGSNSCTLI